MALWRSRRDPYRSGWFTWSDPFAHARFEQGDLSTVDEDRSAPVEIRGAVARARDMLAADNDGEMTFGSEEAFRSFWSGEGTEQSVEERFAKILD